MSKIQKKYSEEFKKEIVKDHNENRKSLRQLESEYGVSRATIQTWVKNMSPIKSENGETITLKEYKQLQKRIKELEIENEILKKATAIFAKER